MMISIDLRSLGEIKLKTKGNMSSRRTLERPVATPGNKRKRPSDDVADPAQKKSWEKTFFDHISPKPKATKSDIAAFIASCKNNVSDHGCAPNGLLHVDWPEDVNGVGRILANSVFQPLNFKGGMLLYHTTALKAPREEEQDAGSEHNG